MRNAHISLRALSEQFELIDRWVRVAQTSYWE